MTMTDAEAADELTQDNVRRAEVLMHKGMPASAWNSVIGAMQEDAFIHAVMHHLGGDDAVDALKLDIAGRISRWLDEAEKQVEAAQTRQRLVVANGKVPRG
ncbi:hypothetical protein [Thiomonas sp.]|jgi:hypothetical protein